MRQTIVAAILLLILGQTSAAYGHKKGQAYIDSLMAELPSRGNDSNKVVLLDELSTRYSLINPDEGLKYGNQALKLATDLGWNQGIALSNTAVGMNYQKKSDYETALEYLLKALKINETFGYKSALANVNMQIGVNYKLRGDFSRALSYYEVSLRLRKELGDKELIGTVLGNIGNIYKAQGNYPKALEYYLMRLKIGEETQDSIGIATVTGNIGNVHYLLHDYPRALEYNTKALKIFERLGDKNNTARINANIGAIYVDKGNYDVALTHELMALTLYEELGSKTGIVDATDNIAAIYVKLKNFPAALAFEFKALRMVEAIGNKLGQAITLASIGMTYVEMAKDTSAKRYQGKQQLNTLPQDLRSLTIPMPAGRIGKAELAIEYILKAIVIAEENQSLSTLEGAYNNLKEAYILTGNHKKAFEALANYHAIKDSVFSQDNKEQMIRMGMKYDFDKQRFSDSMKTVEMERIATAKYQRQKRYKLAAIAGIVLLGGFSFFIAKERKKSDRAREVADRERKKSDELLLNILPAEVAEELKAKGSAEAKLIDDVTVLFTDFKGFTQLSEKLTAKELVSEINTCFSAFDYIMQKHGVEKIKTIGDAYMAAGGLPTPNKTHAEDVVKAALDIQAFMHRHKTEREAEGKLFFEIRIGVHTGPVVAGIVGIKKFAYDIWGDTVNTASRMESSGTVGKVNISETTCELVKNKFNCEYRGEVEAKGKGVMKMYFVS
jgi:class 3 adenylate cyclase/tetratricopeptide (TPR) repeat protein